MITADSRARRLRLRLQVRAALMGVTPASRSLENDSYQEKVFDASLAGRRKLDSRTGLAPEIGNTATLETGAYTNSVGAAALSTVWRDPQFKASQAAVYYARVLEIPTPRWSTLLAIKRHLPLPKGVPSTIQARAWSSPIWYSAPAKTGSEK